MWRLHITALIKEIDEWINRHTKEVWDFCVDVLMKHEQEWLEKLEPAN